MALTAKAEDTQGRACKLTDHGSSLVEMVAYIVRHLAGSNFGLIQAGVEVGRRCRAVKLDCCAVSRW
jgi:hypothetical protein